MKQVIINLSIAFVCAMLISFLPIFYTTYWLSVAMIGITSFLLNLLFVKLRLPEQVDYLITKYFPRKD